MAGEQLKIWQACRGKCLPLEALTCHSRQMAGSQLQGCLCSLPLVRGSS